MRKYLVIFLGLILLVLGFGQSLKAVWVEARMTWCEGGCNSNNCSGSCTGCPEDSYKQLCDYNHNVECTVDDECSDYGWGNCNYHCLTDYKQCESVSCSGEYCVTSGSCDNYADVDCSGEVTCEGGGPQATATPTLPPWVPTNTPGPTNTPAFSRGPLNPLILLIR